MKRKSLRFSLALLFAMPAMADRANLQAPHAYQPPVTAKVLLDQARHALPPEVTQACMDSTAIIHTYTEFVGMNRALEAAARGSSGKVLQIAEVLPVALDAAALFDAPPLLIDGYFHFTAAIASEDAYQLALEADLMGLRPGDEVFVIDPQVQRAHGPFDAPRTAGGFSWLPMVGGDTLHLVVRTVHDTPPPIVITSVSHGFINLAEELAKDGGHKVLPCNNHVACETDPDLQFLSSGIGRYVFNGGKLCSGSLINVPGTAAFEPYFTTANHCVGTQSSVQTMQVFWDYRAADCDGSGVPALGDLPTSMGVNLLGTQQVYDHTLAELDSVPVGPYGRAYLGWFVPAPSVGDEIVGIHHPRGSSMRISYGNVTVVAQNRTISGVAYQELIRVEWYDGVTEGGSSGSPLMLEKEDFRFIGVLTGGAFHVCPEDPERNWDVYGPFRRFFPTVEDLLLAEDDTKPAGPTDINGDGVVDASDIQLVINAALGHDISPFSGDVNGSGTVNAVDVQIVINAALGLS